MKKSDWWSLISSILLILGGLGILVLTLGAKTEHKEHRHVHGKECQGH